MFASTHPNYSTESRATRTRHSSSSLQRSRIASGLSFWAASKSERLTVTIACLLFPIATERTNTFALLRACRQIYAETVLLPLAINPLTIKDFLQLGVLLKGIRKYQPSQIKVLEVETGVYEMASIYKDLTAARFEKGQLEKYFPALQRVHVRIFPTQYPTPRSIADAEAYVNSGIAPDPVARGYEVTVEAMTMDYNKFHQL